MSSPCIIYARDLLSKVLYTSIYCTLQRVFQFLLFSCMSSSPSFFRKPCPSTTKPALKLRTLAPAHQATAPAMVSWAAFWWAFEQTMKIETQRWTRARTLQIQMTTNECFLLNGSIVINYRWTSKGELLWWVTNLLWAKPSRTISQSNPLSVSHSHYYLITTMLS